MGELETDPGVTNGSQGVPPPLKYQAAGNGSGDPGPGVPPNRKRRETGEGTIYLGLYARKCLLPRQMQLYGIYYRVVVSNLQWSNLEDYKVELEVFHRRDVS